MFPIKNPDLLTKALTHRSYLNETSDQKISESNERLEFLGDAVLELIVSEYLFDKFPDKPEGELTSLRAALVKTTTLAKISRKLQLGEKLLMSRGEAQTGGRDNQGLLANTFEAIIGAIYLDSNISTVKKFLAENLFTELTEIIENNLHRDYKSTFQEIVQGYGHPTPSYEVTDEEGPDHEKIFTVALMVSDKKIAIGKGKSKQLAQQQAAQKGLEKLDSGLEL